MSDKHIVIIGHGIAARCVIFELNQRGFHNITAIASEEYAPMCSTRTTAINCLRGTKPGKSDLGDLILRSYADFERFFEQHNPTGIAKTIETHCTPINSPKLANWNRRYKNYEEGNSFTYFANSLKNNFYYVDNEAYIFSPEIFYNWLADKSSYNFIEGIVERIENKSISLSSGETLAFDELIICTSFMSKSFSDLVNDEGLKHQLLHSKPVVGSYLRFDIKDFNCSELKLDQTYCFRVDEIHLIVRPHSQDVLIGATSTNNSMDDSGDIVGMKEQMSRLATYLKGVVALPDMEKGELITGIRHKGQNRRPYWGQINSHHYAAWGLYKNAFTFSFTVAQDIANLIQK